MRSSNTQGFNSAIACAVLSEEEIANAAAKVVLPSNMVRLSRTRRSGIDLSRVMTGQEFPQPAKESMAIRY
jgi:hypothetical protein